MKKILFLLLLGAAIPVFAAGARTEYKLLIEPSSWAAAARAYGLGAPDKERDIYFYDTPGLDLYAQGLVLRSRAGKKKADVTVKYRPPQGAAPWEVSSRPGYKCEYDATLNGSVYSCSLTEDSGPAEVSDVAKGRRKPRHLYSDAQRLWAGERAWEGLRVLGPVRSSSWEVGHAALGELSFERWDLPGGPSYFEASFRAPDDNGAQLDRFIAELRRLGIAPAGAQVPKTKAAMQFFAR